MVHQDVNIGIIGNAQMYPIGQMQKAMALSKFNNINVLNIYSPRVYYLPQYAQINIIYLHLA